MAAHLLIFDSQAATRVFVLSGEHLETDYRDAYASAGHDLGPSAHSSSKFVSQLRIAETPSLC